MRGHRLIATAAVAAVAAGLVLAAACGDRSDDDGYGPQQRASFVAACTPGASRAVCGCFYDRLAATVSYERFLAIDRQIRQDPTAIPDDVADLAIACAAEHSPGT